MTLNVHVFTIFPRLFDSFLSESLIGRARESGLLKANVVDIRSFSTDAHRSVDDTPFGGGPGMVLAPDPIFRAVQKTRPPRPFLLLSPGGRAFDQEMAAQLATKPTGFSLLCGRYEGIDQRVIDHLVDDEISVGDYILSGGEIPAMVVIEAVARLVPGVLGNQESASQESFVEGLLEYPQYTRPASFNQWEVPQVLLSGDHNRIIRWRKAQSLIRTLQRRPDLIAKRGGITAEERVLLTEVGWSQSLPPSTYAGESSATD